MNIKSLVCRLILLWIALKKSVITDRCLSIHSIKGHSAVESLVVIYLNWLNAETILTTNVSSSELSKLTAIFFF